MTPLPRFLCDEMLGRLCRYLRAAGYDTLFDANGLPDRELLRLCKEQDRYFLTQDQLIIEHNAARGVAFILPQGELDQLAAITAAQFQLDWTSHAFTRCMEDNASLLDADNAAMQRVPPDAQMVGERFRVCPVCARVYWQGSHYKRMLARLQKWQAARLGESGNMFTAKF
jgi:uncharacterized protein with PIN domain